MHPALETFVPRPGTGPTRHRPGGTRTPNPRFWRPVLYQLSYGPLYPEPARLLPTANGQGRSRTVDTAVFSRVLYHLSYLAETNPAPPGFLQAKRRLPRRSSEVAGAGFEPATFGL
jgi:hypothetical protein